MDAILRWWYRHHPVRATKTIVFYEDSTEHVHWPLDEFPDGAQRVEVRVAFPSGLKKRYVVYPGDPMPHFSAPPPCCIYSAVLRAPDGFEVDVTRRAKKYLPASLRSVAHMFPYQNLEDFDQLIVTNVFGGRTVVPIRAPSATATE